MGFAALSYAVHVCHDVVHTVRVSDDGHVCVGDVVHKVHGGDVIHVCVGDVVHVWVSNKCGALQENALCRWHDGSGRTYWKIITQ